MLNNYVLPDPSELSAMSDKELIRCLRYYEKTFPSVLETLSNELQRRRDLANSGCKI